MDNNQGKLERYTLKLYIASMNARTRFAIENIRKICQEHLEGCYELEIVDLRDNPSLAAKKGIVATPVLIKSLPLPIRTFIGNMHDIDKILLGLELKKNTEETEK